MVRFDGYNYFEREDIRREMCWNIPNVLRVRGPLTTFLTLGTKR